MRVHLHGEASVQPPVLVGALERPSLTVLQRYAVGGWFALGCVAAVVLPLAGGQLRYPGWFAAQRLALILAPALIGLHYRRRRPAGRFGMLLIVAGGLAVPLTLQGLRSPWLHLLGLGAQASLLVVTLWLLVSFPAGRLRDSRARAIVLSGTLAAGLWLVPLGLLEPHLLSGPIAACSGACPANPLALASNPAQIQTWLTVAQLATIAVCLAAASFTVSRLLRARPAPRRTMVIAAGPTLLFLAGLVAWIAATLGTTPTGRSSAGQLGWIVAASRVLIPFGYLLALLYAELDAGRVVTRIVRRALDPSRSDSISEALPAAVGEPSLDFGFWIEGRGWVRPDGEPLQAPGPDSGYVVTTIDRADRPMGAIVHSRQLEESPELIQAIVTTSLLIYENAALEAELRSAIRELRESRARVVKAGDLERRRIERDLHDGAQQRLISLGIKLKAASDAADGDAALRKRLAGLCDEVDRALGEIRDVAHGVFPATLTDLGLIPALHAAARSSPLNVRVAPVRSRRRYAPDLEAAVYFCCLEALQNAGKHAGGEARVSISLVESGPSLRFSVRDDGCGFDPSETIAGAGLVGMRDRLGAIGGTVRVTSSRGSGTAVTGTVPFHAGESTVRFNAGERPVSSGS